MKAAIVFLLATGIAMAAAAPRCAGAATMSTPPSPTTPAKTLVKQVCAPCHGATGTATVANVPNLAAQREEYLIKQLREFKTHDRSDPRGAANMWRVSHVLTDKQIDGLAAFFAKQQPEAQAVEGRAEQIAVGKYISTGGATTRGIPPCSGCHGPDGAGKTMFPRLAGQHMDYLVKQLTVFQDTNQRPAAVMKSAAHELSPESIANVAAYYQSLPNAPAH